MTLHRIYVVWLDNFVKTTEFLKVFSSLFSLIMYFVKNTIEFIWIFTEVINRLLPAGLILFKLLLLEFCKFVTLINIHHWNVDIVSLDYFCCFAIMKTVQTWSLFDLIICLFWFAATIIFTAVARLFSYFCWSSS